MNLAVEILRLDAFFAGIGSFITSLILVLTVKWHGKLSIDSHDGIQKVHTLPTPRIGGIAIAVGVMIGYAFSSRDAAAAEKRAILSSIILAGIPAFMFGLLEDLTKKVSVRARLFATMASGALGWGITGVSISHVALPGVDWFLSFTVVSVLFTAFAVGGIANAINIIDGFNGLAAGSVMIMLAAFGLVARSAGDIPLAFSCLVLAGAVLGFFLMNWPNGKIFLGDGGAYFVGFALAWIAVLMPYRNPTISPWVSMLICIYPITEVAVSFLRRLKRNNHHPGQPDKVHLHHLIHGRFIRHKFSRLPRIHHNPITAMVCWLAPLSSLLLLAFTPIATAQNYLVTTCAGFILVYLMVYYRLRSFH